MPTAAVFRPEATLGSKDVVVAPEVDLLIVFLSDWFCTDLGPERGPVLTPRFLFTVRDPLGLPLFFFSPLRGPSIVRGVQGTTNCGQMTPRDSSSRKIDSRELTRARARLTI